MPKKRKSSSKRSPQNRSHPGKQVGQPQVSRAQTQAAAALTGAAAPRVAAPHPQQLLPLPARPLRPPLPTARQSDPQVRPPAPPAAKPAQPPLSAAATADDLAPEVAADSAPALYGVGATYWLDGEQAETAAAVQFVGTGIAGETRGRRFARQVSFPQLPSGVGRASLTASVRGLAPGTWHIQAQAVDEDGRPLGLPQREEVETKLWPFVHGPGVRPMAWSILVLLGVLLAVMTQALLVGAAGLKVGAAAWSAVAAAGVGYLSAKLGFMLVHRIPAREFATAGTLIQVFLAGAFGSLAVFAWFAGLPLLQLLDLTTPGVFAAMALARPGCWLGGCCAGRPTSSRWGLWSSDRQIGVRRVPVQLMESALAATVAALSLVLVLGVDERPFGLVLVLSASVYTLGRQLLFPLRTEGRRTSRGRTLTMAGASIMAAATAALLVAA